ncbi:MAG: VirB3 family type IV secretion system protein [Terriglobia bacterium]
MQRRTVIRALNRSPFIFGIDWKIYLCVLLLAAVFFVAISKITALLLLFVFSLFGKMLTRRDPQIALLWAISLFQGGSYDPAKYQGDRRA